MTNVTNIYAYSTIKRNDLLDEFITPTALIETCFEQILLPAVKWFDVVNILDVGANSGNWGKVARKYFPYANISGVEIMNMPKPEAYDMWRTEDFITSTTGKYDLIIGNPPFTVKEPNGKQKYKIKYKAEDFVRKALSLLGSNGYLAFILRSNFRHSQERIDLFNTKCPFQVWDFMRRPSYYKEDKRTKYYGKTNTNAHDNALFVWWTHWKQNYYIGKQLEWEYKDM